MNEASDGPLAEFTALRAEILQLNQQQSQLLNLQLTVVGAVLSVALTTPSLRLVLLIVPLVSYLLYLRLVSDSQAVQDISRYIQQDLGGRIPGGLRWESWLWANSRRQRFFAVLPRLLTFAGASALALVLSAPAVFRSTAEPAARFGLVAVWVLGAAGTLHDTYLITYWYYRRVRPVGRGQPPEPGGSDQPVEPGRSGEPAG